MPTAIDDTVSPTYLESVRLTVGVSREEFLAAINEKDESLLLPHRALAFPEVVAKVRRFEKAYHQFVTARMRAIAAAFESASAPDSAGRVPSGIPLIGTDEATKATGLGEFALANLRSRDKLPYTTIDRQAYYAREDLEALFTYHLRPDVKIHRNVLAKPFLNYWHESVLA